MESQACGNWLTFLAALASRFGWSRALKLVARGAGPDSARPKVTSHPELSDNVALVALVLRSDAKELGYRRS